jgi:Tfp pilus assembly protein PilF
MMAAYRQCSWMQNASGVVRRQMRFSLHLAASAGLAWTIASAAHAAPYVPSDGAQVIERLPSRNDPALRDLKRLRVELAANPANLALAVDVARRYINQAREKGDPRYTGYAQAALAPWWNQPQPPAEVRVLRATILQSTHQFSEALADLDAVLNADRRNAQAWLTRATILSVQGDYPAARNSCARLAGLAPELIVQTCVASVASLNGEAEKSYATLSAALNKDSDAAPGIRIWVLTLLAEIAARRNDSAAAQAHFRQAMAADTPDSYLLGAYADFLLDRNRPAEVIDLLKNKSPADGLLLRHALALQAQKSPAAADQARVLASRFADAARRGDTVHRREQARFELQLANNPASALKLAQENWQVQKEPADARIFLEAALAANDKTAAQPVLDWLKKTGLEDHALAALASRLGTT